MVYTLIDYKNDVKPLACGSWFHLILKYFDVISIAEKIIVHRKLLSICLTVSRGGALGYFWGGYVPPGTPNWHPVLEKIFPKIGTCSRNGPIFYTPF